MIIGRAKWRDIRTIDYIYNTIHYIHENIPLHREHGALLSWSDYDAVYIK